MRLIISINFTYLLIYLLIRNPFYLIVSCVGVGNWDSLPSFTNFFYRFLSVATLFVLFKPLLLLDTILLLFFTFTSHTIFAVLLSYIQTMWPYHPRAFVIFFPKLNWLLVALWYICFCSHSFFFISVYHTKRIWHACSLSFCLFVKFQLFEPYGSVGTNIELYVQILILVSLLTFLLSINYFSGAKYTLLADNLLLFTPSSICPSLATTAFKYLMPCNYSNM